MLLQTAHSEKIQDYAPYLRIIILIGMATAPINFV